MSHDLEASAAMYNPLGDSQDTVESTAEDNPLVARQDVASEPDHSTNTYKVMGFDTLVPLINALRGIFFVAVVMTYVDMGSDGSVLVSFRKKGYKIFAGLLAASIIMPQIITWIFLWQNGMTSMMSLARMVVIPALGAFSLVLTTYSFTSAPEWMTDVSLFAICLTLEPAFQFWQSWATGKESSSFLWTIVQENLLEGPCSLVFTIYPLLFDFLMKRALDPSSSFRMPWFVCFSLISSVANISKGGVKLHFIGKSPTFREAFLQLLIKASYVVAQLSTMILFALMTRSTKELTTETDVEIEKQTSRQLPMFMFFFFQLSINAGILVSPCVAPTIRPAVLALLSCTTMVVGPPGFLHVLGRTRRLFAIVHFTLQVLAGAICLQFSPLDSQLSRNLLSGCPWLFGVYLASVPFSLVATFYDTHVVSDASVSADACSEAARATFRQAVTDHDIILVGLMLEVDGFVPHFYDANEAIAAGSADVLVYIFDHGFLRTVYEHGHEGAVEAWALVRKFHRPWMQALRQLAIEELTTLEHRGRDERTPEIRRLLAEELGGVEILNEKMKEIRDDWANPPQLNLLKMC